MRRLILPKPVNTNTECSNIPYLEMADNFYTEPAGVVPSDLFFAARNWILQYRSLLSAIQFAYDIENASSFYSLSLLDQKSLLAIKIKRELPFYRSLLLLNIVSETRVDHPAFVVEVVDTILGCFAQGFLYACSQFSLPLKNHPPFIWENLPVIQRWLLKNEYFWKLYAFTLISNEAPLAVKCQWVSQLDSIMLRLFLKSFSSLLRTMDYGLCLMGRSCFK